VSGRYQYTYDNNTYEAQRREEERRAEERRIQEEREAQRRIIQAQIESIKGTIKPQLAGLDQSLQTVEIEVQQNLTRAYTAMQASAGQVTANLADAFQVMEQGVKQAMTQYVQRSQQSINQFQQSLAATTENRTAQAQQAIKQATLMVSRLQPLQAYDTMGLMNPIQKALSQAEILASTSPQAATTAAVQVLQQTFQTASTLELARVIDLSYKGQIQERLARLGPKIDATKTMTYDVMIHDKAYTFDAKVDEFTNQGLSQLAQQLQQMKEALKRKILDKNSGDLMLREVMNAETTLTNLIAAAKDDLLISVNIQVHLANFENDLANVGWTLVNNEGTSLKKRLDFTNAKGQIFVIELNRNEIVSQLFNVHDGEDHSDLHKLLDEQTLSKLIGETMKKAPNATFDSNCITPPREIKQRVENRIRHDQSKAK